MMSNSVHFRLMLSVGASFMSLTAATTAYAQDAAAGANATNLPAPGDDIVVTARRRDETLQDVPVTVSAATGAELAARGVTTLEGFSRLVPQLFIANSSGSFQGGAIGLRGISAGDGNVFGDQAVAFNIDGVQIARSTPRSLSAFDLESIQVFKGPQALYYGKNSPGGIISLNTADPTARLEAGGSVFYEFIGHELHGEGYISGPITESLGARLAVSASTMRGWVQNLASANATYSPSSKWVPGADEINGRLTLKFANGGPFTARLKANYGKITGDSIFANAQLVFCPTGTPRLAPNDDCRANDKVTEATLGTRFGSGGANTVTGAAIPGVYLYGNGKPFARVTQYLFGLDLGYELSDTLSIASTTGFYDGRTTSMGNPSISDPALGGVSETSVLASYGDVKIREVSEELRLTSDFDGPLNFMVGGFYQDQKLQYVAAGAINAINPTQLFQPLVVQQDGTSYSVFGSLSYKPTDTVEISGGARYSKEKKSIAFNRLLPGALPASAGGAAWVAGQLVPTANPDVSFDNVSPEVTVKWQPTNAVTTFVSWKRGFLSGGFNPTGTGTVVALIPDRAYQDETVEGFEAGVKLRAMDGAVLLNLAAFSYKIDGLQVTVSIPGPPIQSLINNAATASSKGAEADLHIRPVSGLDLHGTISYNRARYNSFTQSPCYGGQSINDGCNLGFNGTVFTNQDLSGQALVRSPDWAGSIGANYDMELSSGGKLGVSLDGNYTSKFFTDTLNYAGGIQKGYWLLDASIRYEMPNGLALALVGSNLTNEYYFQRSTGVPFTSGPSGTAVSAPPDQSGSVQRGRQIKLQATFKFR